MANKIEDLESRLKVLMNSVWLGPDSHKSLKEWLFNYLYIIITTITILGPEGLWNYVLMMIVAFLSIILGGWFKDRAWTSITKTQSASTSRMADLELEIGRLNAEIKRLEIDKLRLEIRGPESE